MRYSGSVTRQKDIYRACASVVVLRPAEACVRPGCAAAYQVLLLRKPRKKDAWQLPQGGVEEGESIEEAALRELKEEAALDARIFGKSAQVYQYDFPPSYRRFRPDNVCGQRIEYVFALAPEDQPVTVDGKEIDAYVWVLPEQLHLYIKRPEYLDIVHKLAEEGTLLLGKH